MQMFPSIGMQIITVQDTINASCPLENRYLCVSNSHGAGYNILLIPSLTCLQGDKAGIVRTGERKQGNCGITVSKERVCFQER